MRQLHCQGLRRAQWRRSLLRRPRHWLLHRYLHRPRRVRRFLRLLLMPRRWLLALGLPPEEPAHRLGHWLRAHCLLRPHALRLPRCHRCLVLRLARRLHQLRRVRSRVRAAGLEGWATPRPSLHLHQPQRLGPQSLLSLLVIKTSGKACLTSTVR